MEEIAAFFKKTGLFYIATVENGKPRVRPFGNLMIIQGDFYINTGRKKRFYAQIQLNPYVELCAFDKGTWYRVEAKVTEINDEKIKANNPPTKVMSMLPKLEAAVCHPIIF